MQNWHHETDVIVIGSGLAGLSAAIEARQAGAEVTILEKMRVTGGNTRISDGGVAAPNNYLQRKQGIADSPEQFQADMRAALEITAAFRTVAPEDPVRYDFALTRPGIQGEGDGGIVDDKRSLEG